MDTANFTHTLELLQLGNLLLDSYVNMSACLSWVKEYLSSFQWLKRAGMRETEFRGPKIRHLAFLSHKFTQILPELWFLINFIHRRIR